MPRNLDLALIGNGAIGLLVDSTGAVVWGCFPRFDGDATFCALLDDAAPGEETRHLRRRDHRFRPRRAVLLHEHGRPRHPPVRSDGRRGRDHGLRAPIHAARPRVPPDGPCADRATRRRQPARPHPFAARCRLRARAPGDHRRQQPHPLRDAGRDAAAHDRRVADRRPRGTAVLPGQQRHAAARTRRDRPERRRRDRPAVHRGDDQVLARLGATAREYRSNGRPPSSARRSRSS